MKQLVMFSLRFICLFLLTTNKYFTFATLSFPVTEQSQQWGIINAFDGCNLRVINFRGLNIDFQTVKVPILILRYLSYCENMELYPFELHSSYPALKTQNSSICSNAGDFQKVKVPPSQIAQKYITHTFTESFQLSSKNQMCEADIYLDPPTEDQFPYMYLKDLYWESVLKHPSFINMAITRMTQEWKNHYLNTVPLISLLICNFKTNSICRNDKDVKKWIAGVFYDMGMSTLSVVVLIWEYSSISLTLMCPYCDPCDSLKTIHIPLTTIPTSRNELEIFLNGNLTRSHDPHSVRVVLLADIFQYEDLRKMERRNKQAVLQHILKFSVEDEFFDLYYLADIHLTSLLLPTSANITFSDDYGEHYGKWENVIVDSCSSTKGIHSHPILRPMITRTQATSRNSFQDSRLVTFVDQIGIVSCHKELKHWTIQLTELISPFDIYSWSIIFSICFFVSWIVKISQKSHKNIRKVNLFDVTFYMFWSILDQGNRYFATAGKTLKFHHLLCVFFVPITWLFLSTIYKGYNVTRLTADPPMVKFDTFKMLEENSFNTYLSRFNLETFVNAEFYNVSELVKLLKEHGHVSTHEALPLVSELWVELMLQLRPSNTFDKSLIYLKEEISKPMWKYINNSAMLPDYGQEPGENISTILNIHMKKCNKSAMILRKQLAVKLHKVLKQMGKPSFLVKDKILETFWGYQFFGYLPSNLVVRARYLFDAGIFEWWQNFFEYSYVLKLNVHGGMLIKMYNQSFSAESGGSKTAVAVLTLIPGVGLLLSCLVFIFVECICSRTLQRRVSAIFEDCINMVRNHVRNLCRKVDHLVSINVQ